MFTVRHSISLDFTSPRQRQVNEVDPRPLRVAEVVYAQPAAYTTHVTSATKKILEDALALPEKEREALVEALDAHRRALLDGDRSARAESGVDQRYPEPNRSDRKRGSEDDSLGRGQRPHQEVARPEVMLLERLNLGSNQRPHAPKSQRRVLGDRIIPCKTQGILTPNNHLAASSCSGFVSSDQAVSDLVVNIWSTRLRFAPQTRPTSHPAQLLRSRLTPLVRSTADHPHQHRPIRESRRSPHCSHPVRGSRSVHRCVVAVRGLSPRR